MVGKLVYLRSVVVHHNMKPHTNSARGDWYSRVKLRNEIIFSLKWGGAICHKEPTKEQWEARNKWEGVLFWNRDNPDQAIDNMEDISDQYKSMKEWYKSPVYDNTMAYRRAQIK